MSRNRNGFTIIELLVVILVIGILTGIALPKLGASRDKAKLAAVLSDMRDAETAEEAYYADNGGYATFPQLQAATNFAVSPGTAMTITPGTDGYTVDASNGSITTGPTSCTVAVGSGVSATVDSKITCP
jgi:prepilin-type N-terminal cleavage/methylation domain-containing protein